MTVVSAAFLFAVASSPAWAQLSEPAVYPALPTGGFGLPPVILPGAPVGLFTVPPAIPGTAADWTALPSAPPTPAPFSPAPAASSTEREPGIVMQLRGSLGLDLTDNARDTSKDRVADVIAIATPSIAVRADTPHLLGSLDMSLDLGKYARATDQDFVSGQLFGAGVVTLVPGAVAVDAKADLSQLARSGGRGFGELTTLPSSERTLSFVDVLSPSFRHDFSDLATVELRYTLAQTLFDDHGVLAIPAAGALSNTLQHQGTIVVATGSELDPLKLRLTLDERITDASGVVASHRSSAIIDTTYWVNQHLAVLAAIGYQDLRFPAVPAASSAAPSWFLGGKLRLGPDRVMLLRYGKEDGVYGAHGLLRIGLTGATALAASYDRTLASPQETLVRNLELSGRDPLGAITDQRTGLPLGFVNPDFVLVDDVYRSSTLRVGLVSDVERDHLRIFAFRDTRASLTGTTPSDTAIGVGAEWLREMTPLLNGLVSAGVARHDFGNEKTGSFGLALTYALSERMTAVARYDLFLRSSELPGRDTVKNMLQLNLQRLL